MDEFSIFQLYVINRLAIEQNTTWVWFFERDQIEHRHQTIALHDRRDEHLLPVRELEELLLQSAMVSVFSEAAVLRLPSGFNQEGGRFRRLEKSD